MSTHRALASATLRAHLRRQLAISRSRERDSLDPRDPEGLHDFRVAQRRARVLLGQYRDLLPLAAARLAEEMRWLSRMTGPIRDLDVLDERLAAVLERAAPRRRKGILELRRTLHADRERARDALALRLGTRRYARLVAAWAMLSRRPAGDGDRSAAAAFARETAPLILVRFGALDRAAKTFGDGTTDVSIHRSRIDAKKLRYLLEFLRISGTDEETGRLVNECIQRLKALQDRLGAYQDLVVHTRLLGAWLESASAGATGASVREAEAILRAIHGRRNRARGPVRGALAAFTGRRMHRRIRLVALGIG